jgi:hypothetical protein
MRFNNGDEQSFASEVDRGVVDPAANLAKRDFLLQDERLRRAPQDQRFGHSAYGLARSS